MESGKKGRGLRRLGVAASALAVCFGIFSAGGTSQAARSGAYSHVKYLVSFRGEQTTKWSYSGAPLTGGCAGSNGSINFHPPASGSGTQHMTFKLTKPVTAIASMANGGATFYSRFNAKATSDIKGSYVVRLSQQTGCDGKPIGQDQVHDASGCGPFGFQLTIDVMQNLNTPPGRMYVKGQAIPLYNPSNVFRRWGQTCPWFTNPDYFSLMDPKGNNWDVPGQGLLYTYASVSTKNLLSPGRNAVIISRKATKTYSWKGTSIDPNGQMTGDTTVSWVVSLKRTK